MESKNVAIVMKNITKTFGSVVANEKVNLEINKGEILALLGENGSGKTTLMNMLSGIYFPDEGQIYIDGKEARNASPKACAFLRMTARTARSLWTAALWNWSSSTRNSKKQRTGFISFSAIAGRHGLLTLALSVQTRQNSGINAGNTMFRLIVPSA